MCRLVCVMVCADVKSLEASRAGMYLCPVFDCRKPMERLGEGPQDGSTQTLYTAALY